jgi:divalent metal cation (Fe/Co/Zn/Cd) transporter
LAYSPSPDWSASSATKSPHAYVYAAESGFEAPPLIADGNHARVDGYVSLSVIASATLVWFGWTTADPLIGLAITLVILKITWDSWRVISTTEPSEDPRPH